LLVKRLPVSSFGNWLGLPKLEYGLQFLKNLWFEILTGEQRIRLYVWLSLATQIAIVVTGGAVRLTASGLGCPTWPKCTPESLVTTEEMGFHGIIEFGNRLLTFVLLIIALLTFATVFRRHQAKERLLLPTLIFFAGTLVLVVGLILTSTQGLNTLSLSVSIGAGVIMLLSASALVIMARAVELKGLLTPAFLLGVGIILQAVVGGITVLTGLNSWIVGLHFVISAFLIVIAATLVWRALPKPRTKIARLNMLLAWPTILVGFVAILVGVVVTGAGPHAGDIDTPRNGLPLEVWQHYHSWPAYLMLTLLAVQLLAQWRVSKSLWSDLPTRILLLTVIFSVGQAAVGVAQARLGVPALLVAIHMFGAASLSALLAFQLLSARQDER
jgi:cytochrome c oxidase assembly protein subunit 15